MRHGALMRRRLFAQLLLHRQQQFSLDQVTENFMLWIKQAGKLSGVLIAAFLLNHHLHWIKAKFSFQITNKHYLHWMLPLEDKFGNAILVRTKNMTGPSITIILLLL